MSKVDDELTHRLQRAERPVDGDGLFEGLERRRAHRERLRKVQAGMLAFAVLAATAGGFVALRAAFEGDGKRDVGEQPLPGNGQIVFVREAQDDRLEIYASLPDGTGLRQLTDTELNNSDPAVSPDGALVAYSHQTSGEGGDVIEVVPIEGGPVLWRSAKYHGISDPVWSSDGSRIAFLAFTTDTSDLYVATFGTDQAERVELSQDVTDRMAMDGLDTLEHPTWSPDGSRIAVAVRTQVGILPASWDIAVIRPDGTGLEWLVSAEDRDETVPAWSPDGTRIGFMRRAAATPEETEMGLIPGEDELWTIAPDGTDERLIASAEGGSLRLGLAWAPDATSIVASDGTWISRVDPTPEVDPRDNFERLVEGFAPSWQPVPAGAEPTPSPRLEPSPEPDGHEIGLGFRLCHLHPLGGLDLLGDGPVNKAWTGSRVTADGRCSDDLNTRYGVAVDLTGDGLADAWSGDTIEFCFMCRPFAGVDFDADGDEELAVMTSEGSMPTFEIYAATVEGGEPRVTPILAAAPGHPSGGHQAGQPLTFTTGGDAGFSGSVRCENFPDAPVLVTTWSEHPIEGDTKTVHETKLVLDADGAFHVVDSSDYEAPVAAPVPGTSEATACGVDWELWDER